MLAHLTSPLVATSTRLLRAAVSSDEIDLRHEPALEDVLVGVYSRFVLVGGDGALLHPPGVAQVPARAALGGGAVAHRHQPRAVQVTLRRALADGTTRTRCSASSRPGGPRSSPSKQRDRLSLRQRLDRLAVERDRALEVVAARYRDPQPHRFPVAVVFVVPKREGTR